jgi:hypothetical protein
VCLGKISESFFSYLLSELPVFLLADALEKGAVEKLQKIGIRTLRNCPHVSMYIA